MDRPLRPLSASEVAALTEECGSTERAPCLRQLENSSYPLPTVGVASDSNPSPDGGEDGVSRTSLSTTTTEPPSEDALDPGATIDESLLPPTDTQPGEQPAPRAEVVDMTGGKVSVSGADGKVRVLWLIPRHGYALLPADRADTKPGEVTIVLSDGSHQSILVASWDDEEGLVVETSEGGLTRDEG
jgi:hypothetical protein